jgi:hypothetical protein
MPGLNITVPANSYLCQMGPVPAGDYSIAISQTNNQGLYSPARAIRLWGQGDGNFLLQYVETSNLPPSWPNSPLDPSEVTWVTFWATNTAASEEGGSANNVLVMQDDGNLVVYDLDIGPVGSPNAAIFASNTGSSTTSDGYPGAFLRLQDDGNLLIFAQGGQVVWASNTSVGESTGANV